ncbi:uncharacterized protein LOC129717874 isoform X2 [Wyeomyia smithii]|uniref:uncharacterized protein LOC129717874 isoform X2 n=1 Tax=Wyeomyia smithii TaxID=174621 RepID=UPI0024680278|nr:uncharacterized protein LOC129717874 isoform X2 [Wyeomyia smithii]
MAFSLNRIFTKQIDTYQEDELTSSGSETESIQEEEGYDSDEYVPATKKGSMASGGIAPGCKTLKGNVCIQRNPTRRPNPKISNRNALLARENRRRKKEHVENLEKELDELRQVNKDIRKEMKRKSKQVDQLTRERNYLKKVIANKSGIMKVLGAIRKSGLRMTSSELSCTQKVRSPTGNSSDEGFVSPHSVPSSVDYDINENDLGLASQQIRFEEEFSCLPDVDELLSTMTSNAVERSSEQLSRVRYRHFVVPERAMDNCLDGSFTGYQQGGVNISNIWHATNNQQY